MYNSNWIQTKCDIGDACPLFRKKFNIEKTLKSAQLFISSKGVYEACLNGKRVGDFILAPGFTAYDMRIQYQEYDITDYITDNNELAVLVSSGWYRGNIAKWWSECEGHVCSLIAKIVLRYQDGSEDVYYTDDTWEAAQSNYEFCELYDGFKYDARKEIVFDLETKIADDNDKSLLVAQSGEKVIEQEIFKPVSIIKTPKGETVLDFGQNLSGYVEFVTEAKNGDVVSLSVAEILDSDGNFYTENYRSAKCEYEYICKDGIQTFKPSNTFYGFRYVRVNSFPTDITADKFKAISIYSDLKRTGRIETSDDMLNQLYSNILWGQRCNFIDIPTDCPQRDERMGWLGDAQVFIRTASYNYDVYKFFMKWLEDLKLCQLENGAVPRVIPYCKEGGEISAAWADAVAICPWQLYLTYGKIEILSMMYEPIKKWVDYITNTTTKQYLWFGGEHFGDWLELKAPYGSFKGATRDDLLASAFYALSTEILCKVGKIIGEDVSLYEELYANIISAFRTEFSENYLTQTEHILALYFGLATDEKKTAQSLVDMIHADGDKIQTGFVGTPYILHTLSKYGYNDLAYTLLLRKEFPSWLYPITKGATTMWEHWDGIMPDGRLWPADMNSYNHYAYGAVGDWLYSVAGGINAVEEAPGYEKVLIKPIADDRIDWFKAELDTAFGTIKSAWRHENGEVVYEIFTPVPATIVIENDEHHLNAGEYIFRK